MLFSSIGGAEAQDLANSARVLWKSGIFNMAFYQRQDFRLASSEFDHDTLCFYTVTVIISSICRDSSDLDTDRFQTYVFNICLGHWSF